MNRASWRELTVSLTFAPVVPHGAEIAYVYGTTPDSSLSKIIMDYWLSFATSLTPNDRKGSQRMSHSSILSFYESISERFVA